MIRTTMMKIGLCLRRLVRRVEGQDLIEYAVLIAMIAGTVLLAATELGVKVPGLYATTAETLPGEGGAPGNPGDGNPGNGGGQPDNPGQGGGPGQ